jgi:mRNA-degrading endonuclease YafQ of YafQ-DinJ toxin-antitoxin module
MKQKTKNKKQKTKNKKQKTKNKKQKTKNKNQKIKIKKNKKQKTKKQKNKHIKRTTLTVMVALILLCAKLIEINKGHKLICNWKTGFWITETKLCEKSISCCDQMK